MPAALRKHVIARIVNLLPVSDKLLSLDFKMREFVRGAEMFAGGHNAAWKVIFNPTEMSRLLTPEALARVSGRNPFTASCSVMDEISDSDLQRAMYLDLRMFLVDSILTQTDRMSMATSQEVRVPILDHELVEFAATVPDRYKVAKGKMKILVREAVKPWLPESVMNKPKTGFTTPIPIWIRGELKEYVMDILSHDSLKRTGLLNPHYVHKLLAEHMESRADHARRIWSLVSFMLWHENCYGGKPVAFA